MSTAKRILKNMASLSLAEIANKGITLITTAYLARVITPEGYGVIGFATSFIAYFVFLVSLGFDTVGSRETAKPENSIPKFVNSILSIRFLLAVAVYAVLIVIVILLDKPLMVKYVLLIAGLNIFSNALLLNWLFIGIEKMEIIALRQIITGLLNLAGVVIFVHGYADTITAMAVMAGSLALNTGWMLVYYIKKYGGIKFDFDLPFWKILFRSSIMIGMAFFIVVITNNLNMVMLGFMRTDYETGLYNAAYKLLLLSLVPSQVIQSAFFPNFSRMKAEDDRKNILGKYNLLLFLSGTFIAVFLIVFSDFVVETAFGEAYSESADILIILMISAMVVYVNVSFTSPLIAWKREKDVMISALCGGVVNLVMNLILIPDYGIHGAAVSALTGELVIFVVLVFFFYKVIGHFYFGIFFKMLLLSVIAGAAGYAGMQLGFGSIISGIITITAFILINFVARTVTISELKGYFGK